MHYVRSLIYLTMGAVALGLLLLQPDSITVPVEAHCELKDGQRVSQVYRFDAAATPVAPQRADSTELVPTPEVYQYYRMPVVAGTPQAAGTPTACHITLDMTPTPGARPFPEPPGTPTPDEVYHLSHSGIPDLEYELEYDESPVPAATGVTWNDYNVTVAGGEWRSAPGFAFAGLKTLLEYWQGFAAAMILVGVLALAWPW